MELLRARWVVDTCKVLHWIFNCYTLFGCRRCVRYNKQHVRLSKRTRRKGKKSFEERKKELEKKRERKRKRRGKSAVALWFPIQVQLPPPSRSSTCRQTRYKMAAAYLRLGVEESWLHSNLSKIAFSSLPHKLLASWKSSLCWNSCFSPLFSSSLLPLFPSLSLSLAHRRKRLGGHQYFKVRFVFWNSAREAAWLQIATGRGLKLCRFQNSGRAAKRLNAPA